MPDPKDCRFAKTHEWVFLKDGVAVVGVSDHAQHEISDVVFVDVPKAGRKAAQGEAVAVVESVKAAFDIYAPVAGEVSEANPALAADPAIVNQSPMDKGWFFKLKDVDAAQVAGLMSFAEYEEFLKTAH
ncbi:MAG: glycine cleavage system protein GcvH [Elusimicrobia bacterium]|nr:glycine cleavage system protein GcvH [Elusimicrobiota bacterium]